MFTFLIMQLVHPLTVSLVSDCCLIAKSAVKLHHDKNKLHDDLRLVLDEHAR